MHVLLKLCYIVEAFLFEVVIAYCDLEIQTLSCLMKASVGYSIELCCKAV